MEKETRLIKRLDGIGKSLKHSGHALALLALGSCGMERERLDEYSDLDFIVVVQDGCKQRYIEHLDWLECLSRVAFKFKNTANGYKLLFEDDVFCEFEVCEVQELQNVPFSVGRIIWKTNNFDDSVCLPRKDLAISPEKQNEEWLIGEALTNLYVGLGRYLRGEKLSAFHFVQDYAVSRIVELIALKEKSNDLFIDIFDPCRRFEHGHPDKALHLPRFVQGYEKTPESAKAILEYLDGNYKINSDIKERVVVLLHKCIKKDNLPL